LHSQGMQAAVATSGMPASSWNKMRRA